MMPGSGSIGGDCRECGPCRCLNSDAVDTGEVMEAAGAGPRSFLDLAVQAVSR